MQLLNPDEDGNLSLVEFLGRDLPPYAILSHLWGSDDKRSAFETSHRIGAMDVPSSSFLEVLLGSGGN